MDESGSAEIAAALYNYSSRSDFGFGFVEIFVFEKRLPAINDAGSRYMKKKISLASIFRTLSSRVGEYFVHVVGFYLNLAILATWKSFQHGLMNYIDTKAKCRNLKNWPVKGLCGRCLFV